MFTNNIERKKLFMVRYYNERNKENLRAALPRHWSIQEYHQALIMDAKTKGHRAASQDRSLSIFCLG